MEGEVADFSFTEQAGALAWVAMGSPVSSLGPRAEFLAALEEEEEVTGDASRVTLRLDLELDEKLRARRIRLQPFTEGSGAVECCGTAAVVVLLDNGASAFESCAP